MIRRPAAAGPVRCAIRRNAASRPPPVAARPVGPLSKVPTLALVVVASAIWGSNFVAMKEAVKYTSPILLGMARAVIGGTLLVIVSLAMGGALPRRKADLRNIFWVALHMTTVSTAFLIVGVKLIPAGLAALLGNTMPCFMVLLALPMLGERPRRRSLIGMLIGFAGTAAIALPAAGGRTSALGVVFVLLASLTWASGSILYKSYDLSALHPVMVVGIQLWFSALGLGIGALVLEDVTATRWSIGFVAVLGYLSVIGLALVFTLWAEILGRGSAMQASATGCLVPLLGVMEGVVVLGESLTLLEVTGGALVLAGVAIISTVPPPVPEPGLPE